MPKFPMHCAVLKRFKVFNIKLNANNTTISLCKHVINNYCSVSTELRLKKLNLHLRDNEVKLVRGVNCCKESTNFGTILFRLFVCLSVAGVVEQGIAKLIP